MGREGHDGLKDVFTPSAMDRVGPCEKVYTDTKWILIRMHVRERQEDKEAALKSGCRQGATSDVCGSGQGQDESAVQLLGLG